MTRRDATYRSENPDLSTVQSAPGWVLLDFGTDWCGYCSAAREHVDRWLDGRSHVEHWRVEDGRGRALGRAFRIKLWPTLVLLHAGREITRVVRPGAAGDLLPLEEALGLR